MAAWGGGGGAVLTLETSTCTHTHTHHTHTLGHAAVTSASRRRHSAPSQQPCHPCARDRVHASFVCSFGSSASVGDRRHYNLPGMTHGRVGHQVKGRWLSGVYSILPSKGKRLMFYGGSGFSAVTDLYNPKAVEWMFSVFGTFTL